MYPDTTNRSKPGSLLDWRRSHGRSWPHQASAAEIFWRIVDPLRGPWISTADTPCYSSPAQDDSVPTSTEVANRHRSPGPKTRSTGSCGTLAQRPRVSTTICSVSSSKPSKRHRRSARCRLGCRSHRSSHAPAERRDSIQIGLARAFPALGSTQPGRSRVPESMPSGFTTLSIFATSSNDALRCRKLPSISRPYLVFPPW